MQVKILTCGAEMCGLEGGWKEIYKICGRCFKKELRVPRHAANKVAELEFGRDSRRGNMLCRMMMYWLVLLHMVLLWMVGGYLKDGEFGKETKGK